MRILLLTLTDDPLDPPGDDRYGGAQAFMFDLGRYLVRKKHHVVYLTRCSRPDKPVFQNLGPRCQIHRVVLGDQTEVTHHDLWQYLDAACAAAGDVVSKESSFDAVMSYNWISGLAAASTKIHPHIHHILSLGRVRLQRGEEPHPSDETRDAIEVKVFKTADRLVCVCQDELESLCQLYPEIDSTRAVVIPYGVDDGMFQRKPSGPHAHLRWATQRFS